MANHEERQKSKRGGGGRRLTPPREKGDTGLKIPMKRGWKKTKSNPFVFHFGVSRLVFGFSLRRNSENRPVGSKFKRQTDVRTCCSFFHFFFVIRLYMPALAALAFDDED